MKLRNNRGFTLVEIAIVLTIVGLIIGGVWAAAATVFANNKNQQFSKDLVQIIENIKSSYAGQPSVDVTGLSTDIAKNSGWFPNDMLSTVGTGASAVTTVITPFSLAAAPDHVSVGKGSAANHVLLTIGTSTSSDTVHDVPKPACGLVSSQLASVTNQAALGIVTVNGKTMGASGQDSTTAAGACDGDTLSVEFLVP
jgi:prepilin-type N-terminal cleavage/methylation domain-containing protein